MFQTLELASPIPKIIFPHLYVPKAEKLITTPDQDFLFRSPKDRNKENMPAQMYQCNDRHDQKKGK
jgi:hypothetical protein